MNTSVLTALSNEVGHLAGPGLRQGGPFARFQRPIALNPLSCLKKSSGPFHGGKGTQARTKCRLVAFKPLSLLQKQGYARTHQPSAQVGVAR